MSYTLANLFVLKKDKAAFKRVVNWIANDENPDEVEYAKSLSSIITHALIEVEYAKSEDDAIARLEGYRVEELTKMLYNLISSATPVYVSIRVLENMLKDV